jgi:muramidase (phage lysozyme)
MTKEQILKSFWDSILKGESRGYNDHNWYVGGSLKGWMEGSGKYPYGLLKQPLEKTTIGDLKKFQANAKDSPYGKLWATGRYQIIPDTLLGLLKKVPLKDTDLYNKENQDRLGWELLKGRKPIIDYINGVVPDTKENLEKASLEMAKIWASLGVPYSTNGVGQDQSYYNKNGLDRASVSSAIVMQKLKELRSNIKNFLAGGVEFVKKKPFLTISLAFITTIAIYNIYKYFKNK